MGTQPTPMASMPAAQMPSIRAPASSGGRKGDRRGRRQWRSGPSSAASGPKGVADAPNDIGGQGLIDDAADVVGLKISAGREAGALLMAFVMTLRNRRSVRVFGQPVQVSRKGPLTNRRPLAGGGLFEDDTGADLARAGR